MEAWLSVTVEFHSATFTRVLWRKKKKAERLANFERRRLANAQTWAISFRVAGVEIDCWNFAVIFSRRLPSTGGKNVPESFNFLHTD